MNRVGLDARVTRQLSVGMATYVRELARRLPIVAPEFDYVAFESGANFGWFEQVELPAAMRRARLDLVHFMSLYVPFFAPRPSIVTIHDLIHLRFPEYFKAKVGPYYQTVVRHACARAARVITDDERTIGDLQRFLGVDPAKVRVVPLGVDERFFTPAAQPPPERPYLLYVGNHRPHKDLATLLGAWAQLDERFAVDLYLTGPDDFGGALDALQTPERRVHVLGDVPVDRLIGYYAGARALVQPALCEGFGLPILEAMAAGTAVVACQDAVPAVVREAALTFAPRDVAGLRAQLERLLDDEGLRASLINLGRKQAQPLTWDRCARSTADIYREVVS